MQSDKHNNDNCNDILTAPPSLARAHIRARLFSSFSIQTVSIILRILLQIALVPILISGWGTDLYQDWIIIFSASALLAMLDFGTQTYFSNALQIAWSQQNLVAYRRYFALAMSIYTMILCISVVLLIICVIATPLPLMLGTHVMSPHQVPLIFLVMGLSTLMLIPLGVFTALYRMHGDYVFGVLWVVIAEILRGASICAIVLMNGTPIVAAWVYFAIGGLLWITVVIDLRRRFGKIPFSIAIPTTLEIRTTLSQSALYMIPTIVTPIVTNAPIIFLGQLNNVPGVIVLFSVTRTLAGFVRQVISQFCHPIGVEMARQFAIDDNVRLKMMFGDGGRFISAMTGVLGGFTIVAAAPFIQIWTHGAVAYNSWLITTFIFTIFLTGPAQIALVFFTYNNKPSVLVIAQGGYALGTIIFCSFLVKEFYAVGAAIGVGLAEVFSIALFLPYMATKNISLALIPYLARCYIVASIGFVMSYFVTWEFSMLFSIKSLIGFVELGITWAAVMLIPSIFLLLAARERSWLFQHIFTLLRRIQNL